MKRINNTYLKNIFLLLTGFAACSSVFAATKEAVKTSPARKALGEEILSYSEVVADEDDDYFICKKYGSSIQSTWNCHDPKIFQDPDTGIYYVYSTGWGDGVQIRSSVDLVHWAKHKEGALWNPKDFSLQYRHMSWDSDFLKWTGFVTNEGTSYQTSLYLPSRQPQSWAPTVVKQNGKYYMFHGIITDSLTFVDRVRPAACITLAIADNPEGPFIPAKDYDSNIYKNSTLVRYVWSNIDCQNSQIGYDKCYNTANANWETGFGCIDPEFVVDIATGELMTYMIGNTKCYAMTYGSWKGGIALIYVDAENFKPVDQKTGEVMDESLDTRKNNSGILIAGGAGAAYEGSQLLYNSETGYYYIFVSMGDLNIQYRVGVGRSKNIGGPYVDPSDRAMKFFDGGTASSYHNVGGKIIGAYQLGNGYGFTSPGGQSITRSKDGRILFACHTRTNFLPLNNFTLQVREMYFNSEGWPVLNINECYDQEEISNLTLSDIAGSYDVIITQRNAAPEVDGTPSLSKRIQINEDGTVTGSYRGTVTLSEDGTSVVFNLKGNGTFNGYFLTATDWINGAHLKDSERKILTFTTLNSTGGSKKGEYFFGNKVQ